VSTEAAVVTSKKALIAAIRGAAHPTFEEARKDPVTIRFHTTTYTFKDGIHEKRAEELVRNINKGFKNGDA
jgi:mevalonate kinase